MLHHLPNNFHPDYADTVKTMSEVYRVLKDEGAFVINTTSREQQLHSIYMEAIVPKANERIAEKYITH